MFTEVRGTCARWVSMFLPVPFFVVYMVCRCSMLRILKQIHLLRTNSKKQPRKEHGNIRVFLKLTLPNYPFLLSTNIQSRTAHLQYTFVVCLIDHLILKKRCWTWRRSQICFCICWHDLNNAWSFRLDDWVKLVD